MANPSIQLKNISFKALFTAEGIQQIDQLFLEQLRLANPDCHHDLLAYRDASQSFSAVAISELLLSTAVILEDFLIELFDIEEAASLSEAKTVSYNPLSSFKKFFVLRRAKKQLNNTDHLLSFPFLMNWLDEQLLRAPLQTKDKELAISLLGNQYIAQPEAFTDEIEKLTQWCVHALITPEAKQFVKNWVSFHLPERIDHAHLVPYHSIEKDTLQRLGMDDSSLYARDGFQLTDPRMTMREVQDEVNYCIYCHDHDGDFCSKGFPVKKGDPSQGFKKNALDVLLTGCPLEEKISEMHLLKHHGNTIASLAMVMVDNPMCPATGHRICNDCMKACIYQKQDPVNIPQIETRVLTDVLNLPWGVEIYDLLTRWNPLRQKQWAMKPYHGLKVMIAGMGPAGFTLAHHLLQEGFAVVGFDGLKIEPLPKKFITEPIYRFDDLKESLDERIMAGFGGVAEYGITSRWDKNFLKLIYISLMRRPTFQVFGSTRFGGTITMTDAWEMGFDHFVIAVGAGLPKALSIPGSLAPGMRQANDFLMALQLGNAAKKESLTNLQIRLPAVVIGGGLTGVDTATEVQAYYITQVEKILYRYEKLIETYGENHVHQSLDPASLEILEEFLAHGKAVRKERERAKQQKESPRFISLIHEWGGVTIVYRRTMQESPAYINNHEELTKALYEGVFYLEALEPSSVDLNSFGHVEALICKKRIRHHTDWETTAEEYRVPSRSIFVATGTQPNIAYEFEHRGTFIRQGLQYQHYEDVDGKLTLPHGIAHCKEPLFGPFTSYQKDHHRVSLIGDTHPVFHGSVVKAIASGMRTYPKIVALLKDKMHQQGEQEEYQQFAKRMDYLFKATIHRIERCTPNVIELTIHAPIAAKHFEAGQFYRLQNNETSALHVEGTSLQIEPLALIAAECDKQKGLLTFIVIENGASAKVCATFQPNDTVSLMGPTGVRAKVSREHETVLIIGNQLSIALLNTYGSALRKAGNRLLYLGHFHSKDDVYAQEKLEQHADVIIWSTETEDTISLHRPHDYSSHGDPIQTLVRYAKGELSSHASHPDIPLTDIDRIYVVGNTNLLRRFQEARQTVLKEFLIKNPRVHGSVYSTMQCMLKGVCAQCLQWQIDPETGKRTKAVFACSWPDQPLELIDFDNIDERLIQNHLQEQLSSLWVNYLFEHHLIQRV